MEIKAPTPAGQGINTKTAVEQSVKEQKAQGVVVDSAQSKEELAGTARQTEVVEEVAKVEEVVKHMNEFVKTINKNLNFKVHEDTGRIQVAVVDSETNETIREIPSEEMLDLAYRLSEASGNLVKTEV